MYSFYKGLHWGTSWSITFPVATPLVRGGTKFHYDHLATEPVWKLSPSIHSLQGRRAWWVQKGRKMEEEEQWRRGRGEREGRRGGRGSLLTLYKPPPDYASSFFLKANHGLSPLFYEAAMISSQQYSFINLAKQKPTLDRGQKTCHLLNTHVRWVKSEIWGPGQCSPPRCGWSKSSTMAPAPVHPPKPSSP